MTHSKANKILFNSGFTLIELMIAIAILGIVTAIAIPAYNGYIETARMTEAKNNIAAIKLAEEEFFLENNRYFYNNTGNTDLANASGSLWSAVAGYDDNGDGTKDVNFTYTVTGSGTNYTITATGNSGTRVAGKTVSDNN